MCAILATKPGTQSDRQVVMRRQRLWQVHAPDILIGQDSTPHFCRIGPNELNSGAFQPHRAESNPNRRRLALRVNSLETSRKSLIQIQIRTFRDSTRSLAFYRRAGPRTRECGWHKQRPGKRIRRSLRPFPAISTNANSSPHIDPYGYRFREAPARSR